jgi:predicted flap endonuclease-1-like 5' DNA nuclease
MHAERSDAWQEERSTLARAVVQRHVHWAMGVGLIPIPLVDFLGIAGIQLRMLDELSTLYEIPFSAHTGKNVLAALLTGAGSVKLGLAVLCSVAKLLPFLGPATGYVTMPLMAGATTRAAGAVFILHFEAGGTLLDFDAPAMRRHFAHELARSEPHARPARAEVPPSAPSSTDRGDDLSIIEGIGPKITRVLHAAGVLTFAQLAVANPTELKTLLTAAGWHFADPTTWPEQAALAASGQWEALRTLQDALDGGRRKPE